MIKSTFFHLAVFLTVATIAGAQKLPDEMRFADNGRRLVLGGNTTTGFYNESVIRTVNFTFPQTNYWTLLTNNNTSETNLLGKMTVDGVEYDSVGIRFKGQTSYQMVNGQKKSFAVDLDWKRPNQDVMGYTSLNFNNCFLDASFIREFLYLHMSRNHIPSAKGNWVHLNINGQNWGIYGSVQALDGEYTKEWFMSNDGTRWRGLKTTTGGGCPGGGGFGAGTSSLNWLGADTTLYKPHYTLKKTSKKYPWADLRNTCRVLNTTPAASLEDSLKNYLDLDRTLWFLAHEIIFTDDDSYVWKGGMDYYLYWEPETNRITPLEYDGNSCMEIPFATQWSPFYRETDTKFALMNKLFPVPAIRQRYIAHFRTILEESFNLAYADSLIDHFKNFINAEVQADPKKIYTYAQFTSTVEELKEFFEVRRNYVLQNAEIAAPAPTVGDVIFKAYADDFSDPDAGQATTVTCKASAAAGISRVNLFYGTGFVGSFTKTQMFDDGQHGDGGANDGTFGGTIPGFPGGTYVRHYVEAISANTYKTVSYAPKGAEHDVYVYRVNPDLTSGSEVVINELMASNTNTAADPNGQFEDWIELYNKGNQDADLGGWFLSDDAGKLTKWEFPAGSIIPAGGYLIVWADEDSGQPGLHANFKLSASGENLYLARPGGSVTNEVAFSAQIADKGFARIPNGTGDFVIKNPTFGFNNELSSGTADLAGNADFRVFPNPTNDLLTVESDLESAENLLVFNALGEKILERKFQGSTSVEAKDWPAGVYFLKVRGVVKSVSKLD